MESKVNLRHFQAMTYLSLFHVRLCVLRRADELFFRQGRGVFPLQ